MLAIIRTGDRDIPLGLAGARGQDYCFGSAISRLELTVPPQLSMLSSALELIELFLAAHAFGDGAMR